MCAVCKKKDHFARASACKGSEQSVRTVEDEFQHYTYSKNAEDLGRVEVIEVNQVQETRQANMTSVEVNGHRIGMFVDSGCKKTLIPAEAYQKSMGELHTANVKLRPYGTNQYLGLKGQLNAKIQCNKGAIRETTIYVVQGHLTEALLGDEDAKSLGILKIVIFISK